MPEMGDPTRRNVLRGAAVAGAFVWAAPVVQIVAPPAFAAGTMAPQLSYVGLLLRRATTVWRVKYEFTSLTTGPRILVEAGPDWTAGLCEQKLALPFYKGGAGTPSGTTMSAGAPTLDVVSHYEVYNQDGGFYVVLPIGVTMLDWLVHKGMCCAAQQVTQDDWGTCQPDRTSAKYKAQFLQYIDDGARSGNQWLFPAAPNDDLCKTLGTKAYTQDCLSTTVTGTPRRS